MSYPLRELPHQPKTYQEPEEPTEPEKPEVKYTITAEAGVGGSATGTATVEEGESVTLVATVYPDNATDKTVTW